MRYKCSSNTDLDELFGMEEQTADGFHFCYGPIPQAMKNNEELVLENSSQLSRIMLAKISLLIRNLVLVETEERINPGSGFLLTYG